jgi:predicted nucleotidyltransferase
MAKVDLFPDFREFLASLNSAGVKYLVLGGYAVIHYGYRRATRDLDVWIATDPDNARKVSAALQEFAFSASEVPPKLFQQKGKIFMFGREPARIDLLTDPSAIDFDESYARRNTVVWDGIRVPLISFEDLKRNKAGSGREKDLADLRNLPQAAADSQRASPPKKKSRRRPK